MTALSLKYLRNSNCMCCSGGIEAMKTLQFLDEKRAISNRANLFSPRILFATLFLLLLLAFQLSGSAATVQVLVANGGSLSFSPSSVSIQAGDTVQWIWKGSGHSTTSGTPGPP